MLSSNPTKLVHAARRLAYGASMAS